MNNFIKVLRVVLTKSVFLTMLASSIAKADLGDGLEVATAPVQGAILVASSPFLALYGVYHWAVGAENKRYWSIARGMTVNNDVPQFQQDLLAIQPIVARAKMFSNRNCPNNFTVENDNQFAPWKAFFSDTVNQVVNDYAKWGVPNEKVYGKFLSTDDEYKVMPKWIICKRANALAGLWDSMVKLNSAIIDQQKKK